MIKIIRILSSIQNRLGQLHLLICKKILLKIFKSYLLHWTKTGTWCFQNNSRRVSTCQSKWNSPRAQMPQLGTKNYTKLKADLDNPAHNSTFHPKYKDLFQQNERSVKTFGLRMEPLYREAALLITKIHKTTLFIHTHTPPGKSWHPPPPTDFSLCKYNKKSAHPITFQEKFPKIKEKFSNYTHIFTDGSKQNNATTSAAIVYRKVQIIKHLPRETLIFNAKVYAIDMALDLITKSRNPKHVFSGSQPAIVAIENKKWNNLLIAKLLAKLNNLNNQKGIIFC